MNCPNCQMQCSPEDRYCAYCGMELRSPLTRKEESVPEKDTTSADLQEKDKRAASSPEKRFKEEETIVLDGVQRDSEDQGEKNRREKSEESKRDIVIPLSPGTYTPLNPPPQRSPLWLVIGISGAVFLVFSILSGILLLRRSVGREEPFSAPVYQASSEVNPEERKEPDSDFSEADQIPVSESVPDDTSGSGEPSDGGSGKIPSDGAAAEQGLEYLLPESAVRHLTTAELDALTEKEIWFARNEIYARHGLSFENPELNAYFSSKSWYRPELAAGSGDTILLNENEQWNVDFIVDYEYAHGYNGRTAPATKRD